MPFGVRSPAIRLPDLSPFGPIFGKELRATARRRRSYVLRVAYLGALLLSLLVAWTGTSNRVYGTSIAAQAQAQAQLGQMFFGFFCVFSATAMAVIGPVLTATAISGERLGKTLHVLLMTPITTWQIISGKLFSRLLVALTLIGLSLPALALVRLLGGVELMQMVGIVCLCVATVLATASIGLFFSTFMDRAYAVILLSYGAMLVLYAFVPFVLFFAVELNGGMNRRVYETINWMACAVALAEGAFRPGVVDWLPCVLVHLGLAAVLVTVSALILRRSSRRAGESRGEAPPAPPDIVQWSDTGDGVSVLPQSAIQNPQPRIAAPARPPRDVSDHPVLWRETRRALMNKPWHSVVGAAVTVVLLLAVYLILHGDDLLDEKATQAGFAWMFNLVLWLLTCVLSATVIAQEKESDTWTLLLATPLPGRSIVWGKVLGVYRRMMWPGALVAAHFLAFTVAGVIAWQALLLTLWVLFTFNTIWVATGVYLSLRVGKVTFAVIVNLLLAVLIYLVAFFVLIVVGELWGAGAELASLVGWYLPYYYLAEGITTDWSRWSERVINLPGPGTMSGDEFLQTLLLVGVIHVALAGLILSATAGAFDRIVGRAPQSPRSREPLAPSPQVT
jgi:ABC-type transport system involved in multi-copper enzyme maturation permease subunit